MIGCLAALQTGMLYCTPAELQRMHDASAELNSSAVSVSAASKTVRRQELVGTISHGKTVGCRVVFSGYLDHLHSAVDSKGR
jgi:hypothetical protein